jgi:hypothetical protein
MPIKLEFSASVGFIHKEFVTMHGHTIKKTIRYRKSNPERGLCGLEGYGRLRLSDF